MTDWSNGLSSSSSEDSETTTRDRRPPRLVFEEAWKKKKSLFQTNNWTSFNLILALVSALGRDERYSKSCSSLNEFFELTIFLGKYPYLWPCPQVLLYRIFLVDICSGISPLAESSVGCEPGGIHIGLWRLSDQRLIRR